MRRMYLGVAAGLLILAVSGCRFGDPNAVVKEGSRVFLEYSLLAGGQALIEPSRPEKAEFAMGSGIFPAAVERSLIGLKRNDTRALALSAAEAFGERRQDYLVKIPISVLPKGFEIKEGSWLTAKDPRTAEMAAFRVIKVLGDFVVMDRNHPLAGMDLEYRIRIIRVD